jgi:hypothetical protein
MELNDNAFHLGRDPGDTVCIETNLCRQFQLARNRSGFGDRSPDSGSFSLLSTQLDMIAIFFMTCMFAAGFFMLIIGFEGPLVCVRRSWRAIATGREI